MAASDSQIVFADPDTTVTLTDGAAVSLVLAVIKGNVSWKVPARATAEMLIRGIHTATKPTLRYTADTTVTGSVMLHVTSFKGNSAKTPYEWMTNTAGLTTNSYGDVMTYSMAIAYNATGASGASQTVTFGFVQFTSADVSFADGILQIAAEFTDYENKPTIA